MAVSDRFKTLIERVEPSATAQQLFQSHRASVTARLKAVFAANKVMLIGSHARGTALGGSSDIDLLLVLSRSEVTRSGSLVSSNTVLKNVRQQLEDRYTTTDIGKDGQAVVVNFSDGKHPVDVVPAVYSGPGHNNYPVYEIPDGGGGWMPTSPEVHNRYIAEADKQSGYKLGRVARILKFWRATRNAPLNSFHIELVLAQSGICSTVSSYGQVVADALSHFYRRDGRALQDPLGVSGWVQAVDTEAKRQQLVASLRESATHAQEAAKNDAFGSYPVAYKQWDIVFNGNFPKA